jgi:hypothetical protein
MNIPQILRELYTEKAEVERAITLYQQLQRDCLGVTGGTETKRRGRKAKPSRQYREVSPAVQRPRYYQVVPGSSPTAIVEKPESGSTQKPPQRATVLPVLRDLASGARNPGSTKSRGGG